jgi:hypothetical protein
MLTHIPNLSIAEKEKQVHLALLEIQKWKEKPISVEETILNEKLIEFVFIGFNIGSADLKKKEFRLKIGAFIHNMCDVDRFYLATRLEYYIEADRLYLCSVNTAKNRIIEWWHKLPEKEKKALNSIKEFLGNNRPYPTPITAGM